jgi:nucleotide-binding universal stress UspA family protein
MTPLRRIALMTEWTEFDSGAERVAFELARRLTLPLTVVVPLLTNPEFEVVAHHLVADAEAATARSISDFLARAREAGVTAEIRVRRGDELWREVVDETRAANADLIVTRRRGHRSFLGKLRVGEMVRQIAAHAPCPVMMVPRQAGTPTQRILVAVDAGTNLEPAVASAARLASMLDVALDVLLVPQGQGQEEAEQWLQQTRTVAERAGLRVECAIGQGRLGDAIASSLRARPADLLVIGIEPGARPGRLGDAVEAVVGGSACATLLVRTQARLS